MIVDKQQKKESENMKHLSYWKFMLNIFPLNCCFQQSNTVPKNGKPIRLIFGVVGNL